MDIFLFHTPKKNYTEQTVTFAISHTGCISIHQYMYLHRPRCKAPVCVIVYWSRTNAWFTIWIYSLVIQSCLLVVSWYTKFAPSWLPKLHIWNIRCKLANTNHPGRYCDMVTIYNNRANLIQHFLLQTYHKHIRLLRYLLTKNVQNVSWQFFLPIRTDVKRHKRVIHC